MKQYTINFNEITSRQDFYDRLIRGLEFPEWCGKNPDAVWDLLTGYAKHPAIIVILGTDCLPEAVIDDWKAIYSVLNKAVGHYNDNRFKIIIQNK